MVSFRVLGAVKQDILQVVFQCECAGVRVGDVRFSLLFHFCCFPCITTVNRIKEQYKVSVRIAQDSERSGLVRIEGDPKGVQLARRELMEMVQRMVRMDSKHRFIGLIEPDDIKSFIHYVFVISRKTSAPKI